MTGNVTLICHKININSGRVATPPLKSCKVLSLEEALPFAIKCKNLSKSSNHFWFTPIMKLILGTLKKMSWKENFKKATKIFVRLESSRELKVMKIRKSKFCKNFNSRSALKEEKSFQIMHLIEPKSCNILP